MYTESIPAGPDYAHAGTPFYYVSAVHRALFQDSALGNANLQSGINTTTLGMNMEICWDATFDSDVVDSPACEPRPQVGSTAEEDQCVL